MGWRDIGRTQPWTEETVVVLLAIRLAVPFKEVLGAQFHVAMGTTEVLRVPRVTKGGDHLPDNWLAGKFYIFCKPSQSGPLA